MLAADLKQFSCRCDELGLAIEDLQEDMVHFMTLLHCVGESDVSARPVKAALEHLKDVPRCIRFYELLGDTELGNCIASESAAITETSTTDEVGDRRMQMSLGHMTSEKIPALHKKDNFVVVRSASTIADETVWLGFQDVLGHVLDCKRIWSRARPSEAAVDEGPRISKLLTDVVCTAQFVTLLRLIVEHPIGIGYYKTFIMGHTFVWAILRFQMRRA